MGEKYTYPGKRDLDFFISLLALVILLPLLLLIAGLILLTSGCPVLYRHRTVGYRGQTLIMYKFRTMRNNTNHLQEKIYRQNGMKKPMRDPRATRFGIILRKTSLDELPQLYNILKGDMSLVGPRPLVSWEYKSLNQDHAKLRLNMMPGLTGPAQLCLRSLCLVQPGFTRREEEHYAQHISLSLDLKIIFKTIAVIFKPKHGY